MAICSGCGNEIPESTHGVCLVCSMIARDRINSGRAGPKELRRRRKRPQPIATKIIVKPVARIDPKKTGGLSDSDTKLLRPWLYGFNRLLHDMYGRQTRFSEILLTLGITQNQLTLWRKDETWLLGFMGRLENALQSMLRDTYSENDPRILIEYYLNNCSKEKIAIEYRSTPLEISELLDKYLVYLRSDDGHIAFRKIILKCVEG